MRAGRLDRRIVIERASMTRDAYGQDVPSWSTLAEVWAGWRPLRVTERDGEREGEARVARIDGEFEIRWSAAVADVGAGDRVLFDGRVWDVHGAREIGRRVGLALSVAARAE